MLHNPTDVVLQSFEDSLGQKAHCTDDIKSGVKLLPISYALKKKYISLNKKLAFYIWLDIDNIATGTNQSCDSIEERIENENIPTPTLIIKNKDNNKGHVAWRLKRPVCMTANGHAAPQNYIKAIQKAFSIRLGADLNFTGTHVKNPLSDFYRVTTNNVDYALDDLMSVMDHQATFYATSKKELNKQKEQEDQVGEGESRNCDLFNLTRRWAYSKVQLFDSFDAWYESCHTYVTHNNRFIEKLPLREERSIAMSIAKWTWKNRHVIKTKSYNRSKLDKKELKRRQREAVLRTQANRVKVTLRRLERAIDQLIETGRAVTKTALQLITELSYKTIQRYWQRLQDKITSPNTTRLNGNRSEVENTLQGLSTVESSRTLSVSYQVYRANSAPIESTKQNKVLSKIFKQVKKCYTLGATRLRENKIGFCRKQSMLCYDSA